MTVSTMNTKQGPADFTVYFIFLPKLSNVKTAEGRKKRLDFYFSFPPLPSQQSCCPFGPKRGGMAGDGRKEGGEEEKK